jgi:hypothetical protein
MWLQGTKHVGMGSRQLELSCTHRVPGVLWPVRPSHSALLHSEQPAGLSAQDSLSRGHGVLLPQVPLHQPRPAWRFQAAGVASVKDMAGGFRTWPQAPPPLLLPLEVPSQVQPLGPLPGLCMFFAGMLQWNPSNTLSTPL